MKRILFIGLLMLSCTSMIGQSARAVLDKTAAVISNKGGATAHFNIKGAQFESNGTLTIKGRKFCAATPQAIVWFDGKTQWTYVKQNDEVNVNTPKEAELQRMNPYHFIYLYKKGYTPTLKSVGQNYEVHLQSADGKRAIDELYITVNRKTYVPSQVKMKQNGKWTTINISQFKATNIPDSRFVFSSKDYPTAEIIDLR